MGLANSLLLQKQVTRLGLYRQFQDIRDAWLHAGHCFFGMAVREISHTFFDFEIERGNSPDDVYLVKVLSIDGRRFTYEVRGDLTDEAVIYVKSLIDAVVFSDVVIQKAAEGYEARDAAMRLKKHS